MKLTRRMKEELEIKGFVDTRKYRYILEQQNDGSELLERIELVCLGTTAVFDRDNWVRIM